MAQEVEQGVTQASGPNSAGNTVTNNAVTNDDMRLEAIGYRLATANTDRCHQPQMLTGLMLHDIGGYAEKDRPAIARAYGLGHGFGVLHIVSGSSAARAGIEPGDEILAVNGVELDHFAEEAITPKASYDRTETFIDWLDQALRQGPASLTLRRAGERISLSLTGVAGCGGRFVAVPSGSLNAWADGRYVAVTSKMMRFAANDPELAFVVAHEMAHNILQHDKAGGVAPGLFAELGFGAGKIKAAEIAADAYAVQLLARAGYDLSAPERFLRHAAKVRWMDLPITHPGASRRIAIVNAAIAKLSAGTSLAADASLVANP